MRNDTAVYHSFAYNPSTADFDLWKGMGTPEAILARGHRACGPMLYCPKSWLVNGWRDRA